MLTERYNYLIIMLHLIRIIMFVVYEQLLQSLLSFPKAFLPHLYFFLLHSVSCKVFFLFCLSFSLWLKIFPTLCSLHLLFPTHSLFIQAVLQSAFFLLLLCLLKYVNLSSLLPCFISKSTSSKGCET